MKIHDEIDNYLAADLHSDLSDEEQNALHVHLVECASCRQAHQGSKIMNKVLEEKFANEKPDPTFEQRMLAHFRHRVPNRRWAVLNLVADIMRLRVVRVAAAAAVLVMVGAWLTGVRFGFLGRPDNEVMNEMTQGNSLDDLRARLSWPEQKAEMEEDAKNRAALPAGSLAEAEKASETTAGAPAPPTTVREYGNTKTDITRLGVRAPTDMVLKQPAEKPAQSKEQAFVGGLNGPIAKETGENPVDAYRRD